MKAPLFGANVAIATILSLAGCIPLDTPPPPPDTTPAETTPAPTAAIVGNQVVFTLDGMAYPITIALEYLPGYDRSEWPQWDRNVEGTCLDVRQKVLADESLVPVTIIRCQVASGLWSDPYTGFTITNPGMLDIDHLVPLKEAHESGGYAWPLQVRYAYANYLGYDDHLVAVYNSENRRKGARDPAGYLPPNEAVRCEYLEAWIRIKYDWGLSMDPREVNSIAAALQGC